MSQQPCPRCGTPTTEFQGLDNALIEKIREAGNNEQLPPQVCGNCFTQLAGGIARGSILVAREKAKDQKKLMLWKNRVNLIKKARQYMQEKKFSDAAVAYEKYIKVLEVVFETKSGGLTPEQFKDSARTQELTVVASVYWDLMRIYDTSPKYGERQGVAAQKLAQFLKYTPIFPDIIRKAESFQKTAKNPAVVRNFLKLSSENKGRCFIATSVFGYGSTEVEALTGFRDHYLLKSPWGLAFVKTYYYLSPPIARFLDKFPPLKAPIRLSLRKIIQLLPASKISASRQRP